MVFRPDREQLAWAAGFYDGEGSAGCYKNRKHWSRLVVGVSQNRQPDEPYPAILERFRSAVGGFGDIRPLGPAQSRRYVWRVEDFEHGQAVIVMLWPFLSAVKRRQATAALLQARLAPGFLNKRYTGARRGRRTKGWTTGPLWY
jgi:hypothetical protein